MTKSGFDLIAEGIEAELSYLHKERWAERAAQLHIAEDEAEGADKERARQALHDHYDIRSRPETSREALLEQARKNYDERQKA